MLRTKVIFLVLASFLLGLAAGFTVDSLLAGRVLLYQRYFSETDKAVLVRQLKERLVLSSDQERQLDQILEESRKEVLALRRIVRPQFRQIRQETRKRIRAFLTNEQNKEFEQLLKEFDLESASKGNRL